MAFESETSAFSCAVLLDTTGSMQTALASAKNATGRFVDQLRDEDSIAIYGFSTSLNLLQEFPRDKNLAKRAERTRAGGQTALFDAIAQVAQDMSNRNGKKVIVVFTDGADNASALHPDAAIRRAQGAGRS